MFLMQTYGSVNKPPEMAKEAELYEVCTDSSVCMSNFFWSQVLGDDLAVDEALRRKRLLCSFLEYLLCCALLFKMERSEAKVRRGSRSLEKVSQRAHLHKQPQEN